uniref:Uncharacterized protein n=1 Tax=Acrobeloides nanus TaxID=290746 RepID=A0A914E1Y2_9BILA
MNGSFVCAPTTAMPPPTASCCPPGGLWSPWSSWSNCTDSCGACGTAMRTRVCGSATSGCPCDSTTGSTSETLPCNRQPCIYPKSSCCSPYMPMNVNYLRNYSKQPPQCKEENLECPIEGYEAKNLAQFKRHVGASTVYELLAKKAVIRRAEKSL